MCKDWQKSFTVQIIATGSNLNRIQVPLFGRHKVELNGIWYANSDPDINAYNIVQLYSPQFRLPCSSGGIDINERQLLATSYPVFITNGPQQISGLEGAVEWVYDFQGTIELQLKGLAGQVGNGDICVINLKVRQMSDE
jgi:hypothetical protein